MFTRHFASLLRAVAVTGALTAAAVGTAGLANAERPMSPTDKEFVQSLTAADIEFSSPAAVVELAGSVCDAFADGHTYDELFDVAMADTDLTADQTDILLSDSVWYYCPELLPEITT